MLCIDFKSIFLLCRLLRYLQGVNIRTHDSQFSLSFLGKESICLLVFS